MKNIDEVHYSQLEASSFLQFSRRWITFLFISVIIVILGTSFFLSWNNLSGWRSEFIFKTKNCIGNQQIAIFNKKNISNNSKTLEQETYYTYSSKLLKTENKHIYKIRLRYFNTNEEQTRMVHTNFLQHRIDVFRFSKSEEKNNFSHVITKAYKYTFDEYIELILKNIFLLLLLFFTGLVVFNIHPYLQGPEILGFVLLLSVLLSPRFSLIEFFPGRSLDIRIEDILVPIIGIFLIKPILKGILSSWLLRLAFFLSLSYASIMFIGLFHSTLNSAKYIQLFILFKEIEFISFLFISAHLMSNFKFRNVFLTILPILIGFIALYSILNYFILGERSSGWFGLASFVEKGKFTTGAYFWILSVLNLQGLFNKNKYFFSKTIIIVSNILCGLCIVFSLSRTSWLMFGISLVVLFVITVRDNAWINKKILLITGIAILTSGSILALIMNRIFPFFSYIKGIPASICFRYSEIWHPIFKKILTLSPIIGAGKAYDGRFSYDNMYIRLFAENGFLGMIIFLALASIPLLVIFKTANSKWKRLFLPMYVAILVGGIFTDTLFIVKPAEIFWIISGLVLAADKTILSNSNIKATNDQ